MAALKNKRHEKFCHEYIKDMNATQAAIRTGYSKKTAKMQGSRLMTNDDIKLRVAELRDAYLDENIMTAKQVEYELTRIALGLSTEKTVVIEGQGDGWSTARIMDKPPDERSRLKALELMAKRHRILSGDTTIDVQPVIIVGGDEIAD
ncbi:terminase small subunit [Veillonella sp.]|uniref:terminase small subunit n=1 Tax=Veillonella sp. TaxID=1926307 RepID=UPI0020475BFA|nr:terminase small subunit [Veillonella sp.]MBS5179373.1 terminase small subunit [Veillonella sp.]DAE44482.1 MAG TPA: Terminase small subunit [Caudoviricetes sp.]DAS06415.1 MAG TPA: Terminase small subunit [Caudoviricetes sp.]